MASSIGRTKTLPSPIFPVFADCDDDVHRFLHALVAEHDFKFHLRQKIDGVFAAAINLGVPFLATESLDLTHGHSLDADFGQRFFHVFHLERLDDGLDFFHKGEMASRREVILTSSVLKICDRAVTRHAG